MNKHQKLKHEQLERFEFLWKESISKYYVVEIKSFFNKKRYVVYDSKNPSNSPRLPRPADDEIIQNMLVAGVKFISLQEKLDDPIREYCRQRGYSSAIVSGGVEYLIDKWERVVSSVEQGRWLGRDSYLNDMDGRRILGEIIELTGHISESIVVRTKNADERIRTKLVRLDECVQGKDIRLKRKYTFEKHWYYFCLPIYVNLENDS